MDKETNVFRYFPDCVKKCFYSLSLSEQDNINEITLINGQALLIQINGGRFYLGPYGITTKLNDAYIVNSKDIKYVLGAVTNSSEYAYSRFINDGFLTLPFGHRVGLTGNCVVKNNEITNVNYINALSFRLAHSCLNNANLVIDDVYNKGNVLNTLIISPPGCGKTTLVRGLAELISSYCGCIKKCAVVDERFELASCHDGVASLRVGESSFVISGCKKSIAIPLVVRSMSPDVIFTDEVSGADDINAIRYANASGCKIIASVHGVDQTNNEISNCDFIDFFQRFIILDLSSGPGTIAKVI